MDILSSVKIPSLFGTKKQIQWAQSIRTKALNALIEVEAIVSLPDVKDALERLVNHRNSEWWISRRSKDPLSLLLEHCSTDQFKTRIITSAKVNDSTGWPLTIKCSCAECTSDPRYARIVTLDGKELVVQTRAGLVDVECALEHELVTREEMLKFLSAACPRLKHSLDE